MSEPLFSRKFGTHGTMFLSELPNGAYLLGISENPGPDGVFRRGELTIGVPSLVQLVGVIGEAVETMKTRAGEP